MTNRYLHGNSIDAIMADEANGSVGWTLTDNLGTVRDVVDSTGASRNHIVYDSFGSVTSETNPSFDTRFTFTGREFDSETGNYDYRNRPFRPSSGRFLEEDPIGLSAGDTNFYRYLENHPVNRVDALGLQSFAGETDIPIPIPLPPFDLLGLGESISNTGRAIRDLGQAIDRLLVPPAGDPEADRRVGEALKKQRNAGRDHSGQRRRRNDGDDNPLPIPDRNLLNDPNKPPCPDDPEGENQMIVQLQRAKDTHQVIRRNVPLVGVRVGQMENALRELFQTYQTGAPWFKKEYGQKHETAFIKGMSAITQFMRKLPPSGITTGGTVYTFQWDKDDPKGDRAVKGAPNEKKRRELRVELENKRGHNLRYF